jgi:hypothetical protein
MSINSMANAAAARRHDTAPVNRVPAGLKEIARASMSAPATRDPPAGPPPNGTVDTAFNVLFGYIPTEIITLYVAVLGTVGKEGGVTTGEWASFISFLVSTPIVVWLVYAAKLKSISLPLPAEPKSWPIWEMFAGTVAYIAWAGALPQSPFERYAESWYSPAVAGVLVLITSALLGFLAPFFQRELD